MLGSWVEASSVDSVLDVGTGCGLLALMMAQKTSEKTQILGIDVNEEAIEQARENAAKTAWQERIRFQHTPLQSLSSKHRYELIISNPPYFEAKSGQLSQSDPQYIAPDKRLARHTLTLPHSALLEHVARLLSEDGYFYCVLPIDAANNVQRLAASFGLFPIKRLNIKPSPSKPIKLSLLCFSTHQSSLRVDEMVIRDSENQYTTSFKQLCQDFYLAF